MKRTMPSLVMCSLVIGTGLAHAEQVKPAVAPAAAAPAAPDQAMQAAMAKMQELGSPNEAHKALAPLEGSWTYDGQWWTAPNAAPERMTGTATNALIFGGRFLKQDLRGEAKDMPPFEGVGYTGYDNLRKEYQTVWFDNMATGLMTGSGQMDAATKALTQSGDFSCPMTGETHRKFRSVWTIVDANHNIYENYMSGPDGAMFKSMEIRYTRAQ